MGSRGATVALTTSTGVDWINQREAGRVNLLGVGIDGLSQAAIVEHIIGCLEKGSGGWLITLNVDIMRRVFRNPVLRILADRADLVVADGTPIVWACRILGSPVSERVAGADLILALSEAAASGRRSVFVLGGDPGVAEEAGRRLRAASPELDFRGGYSPPWGFERSEQALQGIIEALAQATPDIVYCGLGFPKQERLILKLRELFPHTWFIGSGASHVFVAGQFPRAPRWMQRTGLEWLHRLWQEPGRLFRRYMLDDAPFAVWLLAGALLCRCVPKDSRLSPARNRAQAPPDADAGWPDEIVAQLENGHDHSGNGDGSRNGNGKGLRALDPMEVGKRFRAMPQWGADDDA
jgi:N-acetylglucosaminyldiphosphoundecaprenol N-acetyl-beta-D-mannosaminyltransferase